MDTAAMPLFLVQHELMREEAEQITPVEYEISQDNGFERKRRVHKEGAD